MVQAPTSLLPWSRSKTSSPQGHRSRQGAGQSDPVQDGDGHTHNQATSRSTLKLSLSSHGKRSTPDHNPAASHQEGAVAGAVNEPKQGQVHAKPRAPSFTSSPLTQRPLSPAATSDDGGLSDSSTSTSTATAIDIPIPASIRTRQGTRVHPDYPGPSLGMYAHHYSNNNNVGTGNSVPVSAGSSYNNTPLGLSSSPGSGMSSRYRVSSGGGGHRRTSSSSSLVYGETIHESSTDSETEEIAVVSQRSLRTSSASSSSSTSHHSINNPFESFIMTNGSPSPSSSYLSTSPRIPSSLGNSFTVSSSAGPSNSSSSSHRPSPGTTPEPRRHTHHRRSLPPSTSTSPMQGAHLTPGGTAGLSPSALKSIRRRSSGNNPSPFGSYNSSATSTPPGSPSLFSSSFVGSYEQSLLSGRMANKPSNAATPLPFTASVGVLGLGKNTPRVLKCPDHVTIPFGAYFWDMDSQEKQGKGSPYVGTLDLTEHYMSLLDQVPESPTATTGYGIPYSAHVNLQEQDSSSAALPRFPGYRIPPKGQIQVVIKNANQTAVKLFLVPYDLSDMPPGTKTFVRQKSYDTTAASSSPSTSSCSASAAAGLAPPRQSDASSAAKGKETLRYAIHLQFCAVPAKERERGRKKSSASGGPAVSRRAPGHHTAHHVHHPHPHQRGLSREGQSTSPSRRRPAETGQTSSARPASPQDGNGRPRRVRSNTASASHIYLYKSIRVAFTSRALDLSEKLKTVYEGPSGLQAAPSSKDVAAVSADGPVDKEKYSSFTGPGDEWEEARRRRVEADKLYAKHVAEMHNFHLQLEDPVPLDPNGEIITPSSGGSSPAHTNSSRGSTLHQSMRFALLNTPPAIGTFPDPDAAKVILLGADAGAGTGATHLSDEEKHPEPLTFERSPVTRNAPLPSLLESALSISRPGSRSRNHPTSPEKSIFGGISTKDACR